MADLWMDVDTALSEVPVNLMPLIDDTNFSAIKDSVAYNADGMYLIWHFTTTGGATTAVQVTPTSGGTYDWAHQSHGCYTIEIPASGGASINNDTEGFGWFTGHATDVLPWRGPVIGFRAALINNALINHTEFMPVDAHMQEFAISGATLQPKKVDGSTNTSYSRTLATDAAAEPIVSST
jgi:hypothetical protein